MEDFSALRYMWAQAQTLGMVTPIDLIPQLADPKDLYRLLRPVSARTAHTDDLHETVEA
ncbi:MAG: hypothetical protein FD135_4440 [Comamonadaceae bacterium]|nr:MAG: hypothetical protein FD135_4440 [Comamonadaceae bacterium]